MRRLALFGGAAVVGLALILGLFLPSFPLNPGGTATADVGEQVPTLPAQPHLERGQTYAGYNTNPPTSGYHTDQGVAYGVHASPLVKEQVVHNMEHGAVVVWYNTDDADLIGQIEDFTTGLSDYPGCIVVAPYPNMDEGDTIALTAWGRILKLDSFDAEQMSAFVSAYRGQLGPEAGVCWREGA